MTIYNDSSRYRDIKTNFSPVTLSRARHVVYLVHEEKDLLVGESVKGSGQTAHTRGEGKVGVREGGANQMGGVSGHVASLMVRVDGQVETHQLGEHGILVADHLGEVVRPILRGVNGAGRCSLPVQVVVDGGGNHGQLSDQVHAVLKVGLPVLSLVHTLSVGLGKLGLGAEGGTGRAELCHGVEVSGEIV